MYEERAESSQDEALSRRGLHTPLKSAAWSLSVIEAAIVRPESRETRRDLPRYRWGWISGRHRGSPLGEKFTISQAVSQLRDRREDERPDGGIVWLTGAVSITGPHGLLDVRPIAAGLPGSDFSSNLCDPFSFEITPPAKGTYRVTWRVSSAKDSIGNDIPPISTTAAEGSTHEVEVWNDHAFQQP